MPEQDRKLVVHMQMIAERELKAKEALRKKGDQGRGKDQDAARGAGADEHASGVVKAARTFDTLMEGETLSRTWLLHLKTSCCLICDQCMVYLAWCAWEYSSALQVMVVDVV